MKIQTAIEIKNKPVYFCVYGASGIGKTSLIKTLPIGKTLVLDCENGLSVLKDEKQLSHIALHQDDNGVTLNESDRHERFLDFCEFVKTEDCKKKYSWLFIDSLSEISQNIFKKMQSKYEGFQVWNEYTSAMVELMKFFRDLDHYNVVFTALEDRVDSDDAPSYFCPSVGGKKLKEFVLPCFDEVYRMIVNEEKQRLLVTTTTPKTQAKNRLGGLNEVEQPDLMAIYKKLKGEK